MQINQKSKASKSKPQKAGDADPRRMRRENGRRALEEALRRSDERLQVFFNQSLDGFFFCHFDKAREWKNAENKEEILEDIITTQHFTDVNDAMLKQYNIDRKDFLNLTTKDIFAHDLEQGRKLRRELFDNGRLHLETYERMADGTPVWFEGDYVCLYDARERVTGFFGIQRDITERKHAEDALRRSEAFTKSIIENEPECVKIVGHAGILQYMNPAGLAMIEADSLESVVGKSVYPIVSKEHRNAFRQLTEKVLQGAQETLLFEIIGIKGTRRWLETHAVPLFDEQGNIQSLLGLTRDVTERIRAEEAAREAEGKYRSIFESAAEGIYQSSPEGRFLTVNPAFARMLGFSSPEEMVATITDIAQQVYGNTERRKDFVRQIERNSSVVDFEYQIRRKDDSLIWVSENAHAVRNAQGEVLCYEGIVEDITERKQNERSIDEQIKRLNALRVIDSAINASAYLRTTLDILLREVIAQLGADAAAVLLFNKNTLTLEYATSHGFHPQTPPHLGLGLNQGYAGKAVFERKTVYIPEFTATGLEEIRAITGEDFTAYIGAPLIAKGQVVGVLEIFQRSSLTPDQNWFNFFDMLVGQTAIAINNSQLFENLQRSNFELTLAYDATIEGWSRALDLRDRETEGHTQRVTSLTVQLARQMGVPDAEIIHLRRGALLHDIGKMGIPDSILNKPAPLTDEEREVMHRHTVYANEMLASIPYLRPALDIPRHHHEKWDGSGYPHGLRGDEIPLAARIFAVVDVWDALTSNRPYRPAWTKEKAFEYIRTEAGRHFDPKVAETFLMLISGR
jgi:PAS domain S-box-containing protein/putative nucleotidyltransferase with HDIG domain